MVQNYKKLQNTCSIISRSYSFKEVEVVSPPRKDATEEPNSKISNIKNRNIRNADRFYRHPIYVMIHIYLFIYLYLYIYLYLIIIIILEIF